VLLDFGAASDVGLQRDENQDRYLADGTVFAVADGLGGHTGGGAAASIATETLSDHGRLESLEQLIALMGSANTAIFEASIDRPHLAGMCTTLCALADISNTGEPARLAVGNVGDSRLYALSDGRFSQLTIDHTITENLVRDGVITPAEAATHADRHTLTRAVGFERRVHVDGWELAAVEGTRFLICSDGLTNEVPEPDIAEILRFATAPDEAAHILVEQAVRPGRGRDNVTVVVVDIGEGAVPGPRGPEQLVLAATPAVVA
jgi:protein phosphatase